MRLLTKLIEPDGVGPEYNASYIDNKSGILEADNEALIKENNALRAQVCLLTQEIDNLHYQIEEMRARSII